MRKEHKMCDAFHAPIKHFAKVIYKATKKTFIIFKKTYMAPQ